MKRVTLIAAAIATASMLAGTAVYAQSKNDNLGGAVSQNCAQIADPTKKDDCVRAERAKRDIGSDKSQEPKGASKGAGSGSGTTVNPSGNATNKGGSK